MCQIKGGFMLAAAIDHVTRQEVSPSALAQCPSLPARVWVVPSSCQSQSSTAFISFGLEPWMLTHPWSFNLTNCVLVCGPYVCLCLCWTMIRQHFTLFTAAQKGDNASWCDVSRFFEHLKRPPVRGECCFLRALCFWVSILNNLASSSSKLVLLTIEWETWWSRKESWPCVWIKVCQNNVFHGETAVCCNLEKSRCQDSNKSGLMRSTLLYYSKRKWTPKSHQCLHSGDKEQSSQCLWQMNLRLIVIFEPHREEKYI